MGGSMDKEREAFERWLFEVHMLEATWQPERNCYKQFPAHLAFQAWQARTAQPVQADQPKLVLALPVYEKRRIIIASDEMVDGERLVCVAISDTAD